MIIYTPENNEMDVNTFWNQLYSDGSHDRIAELADGDIRGVHGFLHVIDNKRDEDFKFEIWIPVKNN